MKFHRDDDEELILAELGAALAPSPLSESLLAFGKEAFTFRTIDEELRLASQTYDSDVDQALAGSHSRGATRELAFRSKDVSVEIEVADGDIVGQIIPAVPGTVIAESSQGHRSQAEPDDLGCFSLPVPSKGLLRLFIGSGSSRIVTEWARLT